MGDRNVTISLVIILIQFLVQYVNGGCQRGFILATGVPQSEKVAILETHNRLRAGVALGLVNGQPQAQNMEEMAWDNELAATAQQWANECIFEHDPARYLRRFTMGQNLAIVYSKAPLGYYGFASRIQGWFDEVSIYNWGDGFSHATGHYTQLVWGSTNLVGCGFSYYYDITGNYNKLYVCNYGPGGNIQGYNPYRTGYPSCYNYGLSPSYQYSGLCSGSSVRRNYYQY